jgi:SulP family sulfate permease
VPPNQPDRPAPRTRFQKPPDLRPAAQNPIHLVVEDGGTTRLLGVWASALCLTIVIAFPALISFLPKPVIAGLLFYLSVSMLLEWAIASRRRLPLYEYTLLLLILGVTVLKGFLAGALLGLIAALLGPLFVP